MAGSKFI